MSSILNKELVDSSKIYEYFQDFNLNQAEREYLDYHAIRISHFVNLAAKCINELSAQTDRKLKILDVGPHFLTFALRQYFQDSIILNSLGWFNYQLLPTSVSDRHFEFDLNNAQEQEKWLAPETHDVIVMGEVIEHLYTAPELVLAFLKTFLNDGGFLIIGTPNAVSLQKRLQMLRGINPFEKIRKNNRDPGHFREYTGAELQQIGAEIGLVCQSIEYQDFGESSVSNERLKEFGFELEKAGEAIGFLNKVKDNTRELVTNSYPDFKTYLCVVYQKIANQ